MTISLSDRDVNTVGKEEHAGFQHVLLFPQCFPKIFLQGCLKSGLCGKEFSRLYFQPKKR